MLNPGDVLDERFEIQELVARGGMGHVFRAHDRQSGEPVALKVLVLPDERAKARFLDEAVVLAEIHHPGIVRYVAHGMTSWEAPYLAMEWLQGEDLASYLQRLNPPTIDTYKHAVTMHQDTVLAGTPDGRGRAPSAPPVAAHLPESPRNVVPVARVLQLGRRLASAVAELHSRGIVHRDIKPANVFLVGGSLEHAKLLDLGTVRRPSVNARVSEPGLLIGTPHYMAPEQARANDEVGPEADVWAIGCVLYECLTGVRPFRGDSMLVVLTRIIVDDPPPIRLLRSEIPRPLATLVRHTLAKPPADRPADAGMLARRLDQVARALGERDGSRGAEEEPASAPAAITAVESRLTCMVFADARSARHVDDDALAEGVASCGGMLQRLADGTLLVTVPGTHTPTDQAARAARAALALRNAAPALAMVLATGRIEVPSLMPLDQVVSQAAALLDHATAGQIRLDEWTVSLVNTRFTLARDEQGALLEGERRHEAMRTLLGKPSRWVGRHYELAMLMATFDQCVNEEVARAVLVTAPAGMGKSRLRYEFELELENRGVAFEVLRGYGDAVSAGAPFIMIAPAIRWLAGILDGEPLEVSQGKLRARLEQSVAPEDLERIAVYLGELIGVPFAEDGHDALPAARKDPMLLTQLTRRAWEDWLRAECARKPVVLMLEDLHWGDMPSVQYVDGALAALDGARFFVLALARPEVHVTFPQLWSQRAMRELPLYSLSPRASLTLVRDVLGDRISESMAKAVVERAGGNAFYLEELIRAVAEAGPGFDPTTQLPGTILGMVQARLDAQGPEAKQILRAASIFGEVFWQGGVAALLGQHRGVFDVGEWLSELAAREVVSRKAHARIPNEVEYTFRHGLLREGAYAMLTEEDRRVGHGLAGAWLAQAGERDGLILGEHFMRGGDPESAIPWFLRAAEQALEGNDLGAAVRRAERAVEAGARGPVLGALRALQSVASYWQSHYAASKRYGDEAIGLLPPGGVKWFLALGSAIVSNARIGDPERADELSLLAARHECEPGAESAQIICLCRGAFQLIFHGRLSEADALLARIGEHLRGAAELDALTTAQVSHVRGLRAAHSGDKGRFLLALQEAVAAFERAGDVRNAALERSSIAWGWAGLGFYERAAEICERNLEHCQRGNAQQAITYAKFIMGYILAHFPERCGEARSLLGEAIAECREVGNARLEGWARGHLTWLHHRDGAHELEEQEAAQAAELLRSSPGLQAWARACHARALLALGRPAEALDEARQAMAGLARLGGMIQGESLPPLMLARALDATGDRDGARAAIADAVSRLELRIERLVEPAWRPSVLGKPDSRATLELAIAWGVPVPATVASAREGAPDLAG